MLSIVDSFSSMKLPTQENVLNLLSAIRNMVNLIHYLERAIDLATSKQHSSSGRVYLPPHSSKEFFAGSQNVFRTWITRTRRHLITACQYAGMPLSWIVYHGHKYLVECTRALKGSVLSDTWLEGFMLVFVVLGHAYARLQDPDALAGVLDWCKEHLFPGLKDMQRDLGFYPEYFRACLMIARVCVPLPLLAFIHFKKMQFEDASELIKDLLVKYEFGDACRLFLVELVRNIGFNSKLS